MSRSKPGTAVGSVRAHPLPPKGFDPRTASARELRRYGLPQRPILRDPPQTRGALGRDFLAQDYLCHSRLPAVGGAASRH